MAAARVSDFSGRGMRLLSPVPISPGSPVRIDIGDSLMLGEICYCREDEGGFSLGVILEQVLRGLTELARNVDRLTDRKVADARVDRHQQNGEQGEEQCQRDSMRLPAAPQVPL
jgi:hypothetical protein